LIDGPDGCVLVDAGLPGREADILHGIAAVGRWPADVRYLIVTHAHPDHIGSLAALQAATGAVVCCHPADMPIVANGGPFRSLDVTPGVVNRLVWRLFVRPILRRFPRVDPTPVDETLHDGQVLPIAGGLTVYHTPGHCAGQVCLLWPKHGGVLLAADAAANMFGLGLSVTYEDRSLGERQLHRLAALDFQVACFGHGRPILVAAASRFRRRWPVGSAPIAEPLPRAAG
jgi:glyoxylase-like metal-dependent hydrolase (beta-lactamase superfamily II)